MKKLLVIGAGFLQDFVIQKAFAMGYETLAVDADPNAVGFTHANKYAVINIVDEKACLEYAKAEKIDGVLTAATDYGVLTASYIAEHLGLPGLKYDVAKLIKNKDIKNFVDYVFGVETGLDSNARKNRSGKVMEKWIFDIFTKNGINCQQQVESKKFPDVKNVLRKDIKRFDFVITTKKNTYLVEVNFYADGGGSKPSEVARAYSELSPKINGIKGYKFVWITDGMGWDGVGSFKEAYESIPYVNNITNITSFNNLLKLEL